MHPEYCHNSTEDHLIEAHRERDRAIGDALLAAGTWIGHSLLRLFGADPATRARRQLEGMSDELLHDIGITRGEIAYAVSHGREEMEVRASAEIITLPRRNPGNNGPDLPRVA